MADKRFQSLPGFRDFAPKECALRNYLFTQWRNVAQNYGFVEYEAPILESTELYLKKAGDELPTQLFRFTDKGERDVTLRPELTASLARIASGNQRHYSKPMKWFEIGPCFRYEAPQKGRTREFIQFNADIIGENSSAADAELLALAIDTMLALGFREGDFILRASDRQSWLSFCENQSIEDVTGFLQIIDKIERDKPEVLIEKLSKYHVSLETVQDFIANPANASECYNQVVENLTARGLGQFIELDLTIVRGLAYYTGIVFEIFDTRRSMRAIAGGGRYDDLLKSLSNEIVDLPCTGFAMGDVVIANFIDETPHAAAQRDSWLATQNPTDVYLVIADEQQRSHALRLATQLRQANIKADYSMSSAGFGKQFKKASSLGAKIVIILGSEYPEVQLKIQSTREEITLECTENLIKVVKEQLSTLD